MKTQYFFKSATMAFVGVLILTAIPQIAHAQSKGSIKKQEKAMELQMRQAELDAKKRERELELEMKQLELNKKRAEMEMQQAEANQYKSKLEEYKSKGWTLSGGSRTLEVALIDHYRKKAQGFGEITGQTSNCHSINVCHLAALNDAINRYATEVSAIVKGTLGTMLGQSNTTQSEVNYLTAQFATKVKAEVGGMLTESYSVVKENKEGSGSFETVYFINKEKANASARKALEQSLLETKIVGLELDEIFKSIDERINKNFE